MKKMLFSIMLSLILCLPTFAVNASQLSDYYGGTWWDLNSQRCYINITADNDTVFIAISWGNGMDETFEWIMTGIYNPTTYKVHYSDCISKISSSDAYGNPTEIIRYVNGSGTIYIAKNGYLYWEDNMEQAGARCYFEKEVIPNWIGTYVSDDNQIISISAYNNTGVLMTFTGYGEEGWYTWTKLLPYWYGSKDYVCNDEYINNRMVFTIYDTGINVDVLPGGGWAEGFYARLY